MTSIYLIFESMKATEARMVAEAANTANLEEVYQQIELWAKKGDFAFHIYYTLTKEQKAQLEGDGYVVTDVSERMETCINISWA